MLNTEQKNLSAVIDHNWCIGCGVCTIVDQKLSLELDPTKQMFQPSDVSGAEAASVCPAICVDYERLHQAIFPESQVTEYGVVESVCLAQSTNAERNLKASSGGIVKEILRHALESGRVDGVIALTHIEGLAFGPALFTNSEVIDSLPGSIYHNLDQSDALRILKQSEGRYALVAIPCQLEGIFQYVLEFEPELLPRIELTVGLLCGWQYNHHAIKAMGAFQGFDASAIEEIAYRGGGPVGKLKVRLKNGKQYSASRRIDFSYQVAFDRHFNVPRCHLCINHSNFFADIVVGDAWLPSTVMTKAGVSLVIARRPKAAAIIDELVGEKKIVITEATVEEIRESQTNRVIFGDFAYAYEAFLSEKGVPHPRLFGPNRSRSSLVSRKEVQRFHDELSIKLKLQWEGRYARLWWRKATIEAPRLIMRYLKWFGVRILKLKSLTGQRQEINKDALKRFR